MDQTQGYRNNIQTMMSRNPDFIAIAGDLVESGNEQRDWDEFWKHNAGTYSNIASYVPILPAMGNHENHSGADGGGGTYTTPLANAAAARIARTSRRRTTARATRRFRTGTTGWTTARSRTSRSTAATAPTTGAKDTNWLSRSAQSNAPDFNPGSAQYVWLEQQLADAQATSRFTFVQFHHVPYSVGPHGFAPRC